MKTVFKLISENLSGLGGPMGSERTSINFTKLFSNIDSAKKCAEKDYGKKIEWRKSNSNDNSLCSGDLNYVMYYVSEIIIND